jgi:hypothetical protein
MFDLIKKPLAILINDIILFCSTWPDLVQLDHLSTQEGGLKKFQNYVILNVHILDNTYTMQRCNEQKAINCAKNNIIVKFHNL